MDNKLKTVIVGRNTETARSIEALISKLGWLNVKCHLSSNGHADLLRGLDSYPEVLIVDLSHLWKEELEALNKIPADEKPQIIVVGMEENTSIMRSAMKAGACDYYSHPIDMTGFSESLKNITTQTARQKSEENAKLITVLNGKGGSGSTMFASNLSYVLAKKFDKSVALYDFHTDITSLPLYFDIDVYSSLAQILSDLEHLDEIALKGSMIKYDEKLHILTSKRNNINRATTMGSFATKKLLKLASRTFEYIVVDMPVSMNEDLSIILNHSDEIYLVTQQSIPHLSETTAIYKYLVKQGVDKDKISIVVNRFKSKEAIRVDEIKQSMGDHVLTIPSDYKTVNFSLNVGKPIYACAKRTPVSQSIVDIGKNLIGTETKGTFGNLSKPFSNLFGQRI